MRLKELRKATGLSQTEFGKIFHLPQTTYSNYENGRNIADYDLLMQFADYFHVSLDYLLGREFGSELSQAYMTDEQKELVQLVLKLDKRAVEDAATYVKGLYSAQIRYEEERKKYIAGA